MCYPVGIFGVIDAVEDSSGAWQGHDQGHCDIGYKGYYGSRCEARYEFNAGEVIVGTEHIGIDGVDALFRRCRFERIHGNQGGAVLASSGAGSARG